jgi:chromosome partitioning protein
MEGANMEVWAVISQKGGSGKSTLSIHLAIMASAGGRAVLVIDLDPQRSAEKWSHQRSGDAPIIIAGETEKLPEMLATAQSMGVDLVVLDTAPRMERAAVSASKSADLLILPTRPTILDIPATQDTIEMADLAGQKGRAVIVLNGAISRTVLPDEAKSVFEDMGVAVCPHTLGNRIDYQRALTEGKGVTEFNPKGKAAEEIRAVYEWICQYISELT